MVNTYESEFQISSFRLTKLDKLVGMQDVFLMMVKNLKDDKWGLVEQLLPKKFFLFWPFLLFCKFIYGVHK